MNYLEIVCYTSIEVLVTENEQIEDEPLSYGSGFIVHVKGSFYFVTASHVTDIDNSFAHIPTHEQVEGLQSKNMVLNGGTHYDIMDIKQLISNYESNDTLRLQGLNQRAIDLVIYDIDPSKYDGRILLYQPETTLLSEKIQKHQKLTLTLCHLGEPHEEDSYGFFGKINHSFNPAALASENKLEICMKYQSSSEFYHLLKTQSIINSEDEYSGCSGAPVIGFEKPLIIGMACSVVENSNSIFVLKASIIKEVLLKHHNNKSESGS